LKQNEKGEIMNSGDRLKALFFVWGAFVLAAIAAVDGSPLQEETVVIAFFFVIGALVATRYIMNAPIPNSEDTGKVKSGKVSRLLASLNDEELDMLRKRLAAETTDDGAGDGEVVSLEDVLRKERTR
jgi:hypothetical protein